MYLYNAAFSEFSHAPRVYVLYNTYIRGAQLWNLVSFDGDGQLLPARDLLRCLYLYRDLIKADRDRDGVERAAFPFDAHSRFRYSS